MVRLYRSLIIFGTIAAMVLLIGCGQPTTTGTTGLFTATTTPSPKATYTPTRTANTGPVTLHVDAQSYRSNDTITVTLNNQSNQTIYFPDHLTNCSVILLLRLPVQPLNSDSGQAVINPCRTEIATRIHSLPAGQNLVVKLIAPATGWPSGLYRAALSYFTSLSLKAPTTIYTTAFTVGPFSPQP
ncbi:MAG TPA: hypothetical protein VKR83_20495 [Ktedonobacteraceae bacterium]|nr:hypothetical protein [Ktedonobacteraceae bacterium]